MKKQIIIPTTLAAALLGGTALMVTGSSVAAEDKWNSDSLVAVTSTLQSAGQIFASQDETVYVITDESGAAKTKFIGNTIYTGQADLPYTFKVTYYLDGAEISAKDLAGKSGHVKIVYAYNSAAKYLGKNVPFLALTGLTLNANNFSNLKLENGKIVTQTSDSYIITGYAITGLNGNLGTDFLPESFTLEADTTKFELGNTYTIFTNEVLAEIDTSRLNDLDSLTSSVYELSDGLDKIIAGTTDLSNGLSTALDGVSTLYAGSQKLSAGAEKVAAGASSLSNNLNNLDTKLSSALVSGASDIFNGVLKTTSDTINSSFPLPAPIELTQSNYSAVLSNLKEKIPDYASVFEAAEEKLDSIATFCGYLGTYTGSVHAMAEGIPELVSGSAQVSAGAAELSAGLGSLLDGTTQLYDGSVTLQDGLNTFKTSGIDKLVNFASKDLTNFTSNLRSSVSAATSYKSFGDQANAKSVKFIVKTPSI